MKSPSDRGATTRNFTRSRAFGSSLQKHTHRSEKWIVVAGEGLAIVNDEKIHVSNGSVVDVPCGAIHRIGNTGDKPLVMIEVACGEILTEEDIVRLQDDYAR
jgi:mannose-6-phosphate isomerase-like protein (cupin superfamily)